MMNDEPDFVLDFDREIIRWTEDYLAATDDRRLLPLDGEMPAFNRPGFPVKVTRAQWTRNVLQNKVMIMCQFYLGEPRVTKETRQRGYFSDGRPKFQLVDVTWPDHEGSATRRFNAYAAPRAAVLLDGYRTTVLMQRK